MLKTLARLLRGLARRLDRTVGDEVRGNEPLVERSTESREDEQNQRDQIALMRAIIEHLPTGIFAKDAQGRFTLVNRAWIRSLGLPAEQVVGKTVHEIYQDRKSTRLNSSH